MQLTAESLLYLSDGVDSMRNRNAVWRREVVEVSGSADESQAERMSRNRRVSVVCDRTVIKRMSIR